MPGDEDEIKDEEVWVGFHSNKNRTKSLLSYLFSSIPFLLNLWWKKKWRWLWGGQSDEDLRRQPQLWQLTSVNYLHRQSLSLNQRINHVWRFWYRKIFHLKVRVGQTFQFCLFLSGCLSNTHPAEPSLKLHLWRTNSHMMSWRHINKSQRWLIKWTWNGNTPLSGEPSSAAALRPPEGGRNKIKGWPHACVTALSNQSPEPRGGAGRRCLLSA